MHKKTKWYKTCPKCGRIQYYVSKYTLKAAKKKNTICRTCNIKEISTVANKMKTISKVLKGRDFNANKFKDIITTVKSV